MNNWHIITDDPASLPNKTGWFVGFHPELYGRCWDTVFFDSGVLFDSRRWYLEGNPIDITHWMLPQPPTEELSDN